MDKYSKANAVLSKFCHSYMSLKKELPIRPSEMGLLNIIVMKEGKFTPVMLAELLGVSKPMITAHITALEKKGYIKKEYSKEDKRSFYVIPTQKAKELVKTTSKKTNGYLFEIESSIGTERFETLLSILDDTTKILTNMKGDNL